MVRVLVLKLRLAVVLKLGSVPVPGMVIFVEDAKLYVALDTAMMFQGLVVPLLSL